MTQEEKAQRYDEAIEIAKRINNEQQAQPFNIMTRVFPELKESEDERIKRNIIAALKGVGYYDCDLTDECLAWLEKQGEQKPAWSEEDEEKMKWSINNLTELKDRFGEEYGKVGDCINWLKSLKDRIQPQSQSDERYRLLGKLKEWLDEYVSNLADVDTATLICSFTNYLDGKLPKSLRPQNTWKPSKEQIIALRWVLNKVPYNKHKEEICGLLDQIKDL